MRHTESEPVLLKAREGQVVGEFAILTHCPAHCRPAGVDERSPARDFRRPLPRADPPARGNRGKRHQAARDEARCQLMVSFVTIRRMWKRDCTAAVSALTARSTADGARRARRG